MLSHLRFIYTMPGRGGGEPGTGALKLPPFLKEQKTYLFKIHLYNVKNDGEGGGISPGVYTKFISGERFPGIFNF